jgi:hypothetical protein
MRQHDVFPTTEACWPTLHRGFSVEELEVVLAEWHTKQWEAYLRGERRLGHCSPLSANLNDCVKVRDIEVWEYS